MAQTTTKATSGGLTEEQLAFYDREGYLVLPHLLSAEEMAPGREAMQQKGRDDRR